MKRRRHKYSGTGDPRTYVDPGYPGQFYPGSWSEIFTVARWSPFTKRQRRWLEKYNGGKY